MANTTAANVFVVDTTGVIASNLSIKSIRYIAGTGTPSVIVKDASASGTTIYENANTSSEFNQVEISAKQGIHVTIAGVGTKVYLYLK